MIQAGTIANLVNQEKEIFTEAQELAYKKGLVLSSGIILTQACKTAPLCRHCSWRSRKHLVRENLPTCVEDVVAKALQIERCGVDRILLISGWMGESLPAYFFDYIEAVKANTRLDITTTFGALSKPDLVRLKEIGVDRINCGLETTNPDVFHNLMPGSDYQSRLRTLSDARELGFKTRSHLLVGIGESIDDIDDSIRLIEQLEAEFLTIAALDPLPYTETEQWDKPNPYYVAKIVAAARITLPQVDISSYFGGGIETDLIWGMKSGTNAFVIFTNNEDKKNEAPEHETERLKTMWNNRIKVKATFH